MITKSISGRQRVMVAATRVLPFFFVSIFVITLVLALVIVRKASLPGHSRLPNGYDLMMISTNETGWIYNAQNEDVGKSIAWQKAGVDGVKALQIAGRYILGRRDPRGLPLEVADMNGDILVDTQTAGVTNLSTLPQLQEAAGKLGIQVNLEPVYDVYLSTPSPAVYQIPDRWNSSIVDRLCVTGGAMASANSHHSGF